MKVTFRNEQCIIIKFDEKRNELRQNGWLGDEDEARIFKVGMNREIRIFKTNGESYVLSEDSKDAMVKMKANKLIEFVNKNLN
jgi:hypothetical protein